METQVQQSAPVPVDSTVPQNGLAGLKHWRQDIPAGLVVALVSIPLSLGIALASGAPPICGLTSEIIAGLIFPLLGGAYVTISGPAAGLAPVLYSSMLALGKGDLHTGYGLLTAVIMFCGVAQVILTGLNCARFSYLFPSAAVQGMLSSIGFMLIAKQIPNYIGHPFKAHEFFGMLMETPSEVVQLQPQVFAISSICLALLFILPRLRIPGLKTIPPQLVVVVVGAALAAAWHLDPKYLVNVPSNPLEHGIVPPNFSALFSDPSLVGSILIAILTITFVDGTESLATILAVDKIDPFHRKSSPNRTLFAMGISNICSSLIGGLTIIPGIIKSTTCIVSGGRTAWVNFYNALFILFFLLVASDLIKTIPVGALAAVLVHIGWKLAGPHKWRHINSLGQEQMLIYVCTILVTVSTDLMLGIFSGIALKLLILIYYNYKIEHEFNFSSFLALFKSPIETVTESEDATEIQFSGPMVCFNSLPVRAACESALLKQKPIRLSILSSVNMVDHSTSTFLESFKSTCERLGVSLMSSGTESLQAKSSQIEAFRYRAQTVSKLDKGMKVVLAIDESEHSQEAIRKVISSRWPAHSELIVLTAIHAPFSMNISAQHEDKAKKFVHNAADLIHAENPVFEKVEGLVLKGNVVSDIQTVVQERHADLLMVGTRKNEMSKLLLGSVSHALLLSTLCSIHICRPTVSATGNKVMIAIDDTKFSLQALEEVSRREWTPGTEFLCVTAIPTLTESFYEVPDTYQIRDLEVGREKQVKAAEIRLKSSIQLLQSYLPECSATYKIINGKPAPGLLKTAETEQIDLIILGSAGKSFTQKLVVGSVSEAVAVQANCSVEVYKLRKFTGGNA